MIKDYSEPCDTQMDVMKTNMDQIFNLWRLNTEIPISKQN